MEEVCLQRNYKSEQENILFIESEFHAAELSTAMCAHQTIEDDD